MSGTVLAMDRGRRYTKAYLLAPNVEVSRTMDSVAVRYTGEADDEGDPTEKLIIDDRIWLVGARALAWSPDSLFRTVGSKTRGDAATEFKATFCSVLAWASQHADLTSGPLLVVSAAPDNEWQREKEALKESLSGTFEFQTAAPLPAMPDTTTHLQDAFKFSIPFEHVTVARESMAPLWAYTMRADGEYRTERENPLMYAVGGLPGQDAYQEADTLVFDIGFRDWKYASTKKGARQSSKSGSRGVSDIYDACWEVVTSAPIAYSLKSKAELDSVLAGKHAIWTKRDRGTLYQLLERAKREKGASLLNEVLQWAGDLDQYHQVLACGGGSLLLRDLVNQTFGNVTFADHNASARGLAYAGMRQLRSMSL